MKLRPLRSSPSATEKHYRRLLAEQARSGQSVSAFAAQRVLSAWTLYGWRRRLGLTARRTARREHSRLVEVSVGAPSTPDGSGSLVVHVFGRHRVELPPGFDEDELRRLLAVLSSVLSLHRGTRIFLAAGPTDMRKSYDGLSGLVRHELQRDPLSGELFVFCNRDRNRLKILLFEGAGMWLLAKRLERGTFSWPAASSSGRRVELLPEELSLLLGGLDASDLRPRRWKRQRVA